ncbi:unnamed protein product [Effrenium voratum]|nr:unnamed protein product [Effrenium voratum]|mmetsp:Transcript_20308/g.48162  ORF Transcript_20308/g.48162 Transcript_20308/m.48162 type:complete len:449 (+) Transcript_20308:50-1396(+)
MSYTAAPCRNVILFGLVSFCSTLLLEVLLESATRHGSGGALALGLTFGEFLGCCLIASFMGGTLTDRSLGDGQRRRAGFRYWRPYLKLSTLLLIGTGLPNLAVSWVQYPLKVTIKSSKLMLAMAVAAMVGNSRKFRRDEYFVAFLLCVGNLAFSFGSGTTDAPASKTILGVICLLGASLSDTLAVNAQQKMMQEEHISPNSLMLRQNVVGLVASVVLLLSTNALPMLFALGPKIIFYILGTGFLTGMSAWANTHMVNEAGAVAQARLSALRKFLTVVLSYLLFPKPLGAWRAGSLFLVALSLTVHLYQCRKKSPAPLAASPAQAKYVRNVSATSDEASTEASVQVAETASEKDEASTESSEEGASSSLPQLRSFGHDEVKDFEDPSVGSVQVMKYASEKDEANDSDTSTTCSDDSQSPERPGCKSSVSEPGIFEKRWNFGACVGIYAV